MDDGKMCFCKRGKRNAAPHALGERGVLLLWGSVPAEENVPPPCAVTSVLATCGFAGGSVPHAFELPRPFSGPRVRIAARPLKTRRWFLKVPR